MHPMTASNFVLLSAPPFTARYPERIIVNIVALLSHLHTLLFLAIWLLLLFSQ